ncbi:MAG: polyphosphate:AMP phosphotransferase [Clostridiales bacterium]|nr:polyphosphate:AMP phosphotransferase [Clostridiales bacterium]
MLEKVDLNLSLDKKNYRKRMDELETRLKELQQTIGELNIPVVIAFEGWSSSGKGTMIKRIVNPLDPRQFKVYAMGKLTEEITMRPFLWSYGTKTPARGLITIFDKSWSRGMLPESIFKWRLSEKEKAGYYYDVNAFERQLHDDGTLIVKFFLHISKDEQKNRLKALEKNPATKWRVDDSDKEQNDAYDKLLPIYEDMIHRTNSAESPWSIIEANDLRYAAVKIIEILISRLEAEVENRRAHREPGVETVAPPRVSILSAVKFDETITDEDYKKKLEKLQSHMAELGYALYAKRKAAAIVYEGWDAAGKGGNIKRLTKHIDPRGYEVVPIAAPTPEELSHHYLWRFYNRLPKDGHMAIFDRSWYGRLMVERIEGFCTPREWQRAYSEINDMELHWTNHGLTLFKFWMHIDKDEQLRRFKARQSDPLKQYKITEEDWRNREKWDLYEQAVDEMLFRTNTSHAPWIIIESNDKKLARIKVLETVVDKLSKSLRGAL